MAKRRANGEGSIRKRKDGRWEGRYTAGRDPVTGKVIYKNVLGRTQAEVKAKLKAAIEANTNLDIVKAEQYTVGQWMDVWFENCAKIKVRPSSHQTYRGYIDNHIKPNIGSVPLSKLSSLDLQKLYKKLLNGGRVERIESKKQAKGLSAKTVRNINQVISSAMDFAKDQKLIASNPTNGCALPKLEHREMKTLPVEQLASFLREAKETGVFEMYYIELATGLRRGELLGLKWEDIDWEPGSAAVGRRGGSSARAEKKKWEKPIRVPIPHRRPHLAGQRTPYAPPGAETGGIAESALPRPQTHICDPGPTKRSGHQNRLRDAGPLLRRIHPGHLHPRHHLREEGSGEYDGWHPLRCSPVVSGHFAVWVSAWVRALTQIFNRTILCQKQRKSSEISRSQNFSGCGDRT